MEAHYRIMFTMTVPDNVSLDTARKYVDQALTAASIRVGFIGGAVSRETLRARRRANKAVAQEVR